MQAGELICEAELKTDFTKKCPFSEKSKKGKKREPENIADDDKDSVQESQDNDGGVLGENLMSKGAGVGTDGPEGPKDYLFKQNPQDTKRGKIKRLVRMDAYKEAEEGDYPFTVAAHHLIPGNASLYDEKVKLVRYLDDEGKVKSANGKSYTIDGYIGYDVNGSHNGVWLPGNYAIVKAKPKTKKRPAQVGTTPVEGEAWSELYEEWQFLYVAAVCKAARGQFHDSHERPYSSSVNKNLLKIEVALSHHLDSNCPDCAAAKKAAKVPPPYRIKTRLYKLSKTLRGFVQGAPGAWKAPWFTSQKWSAKIFVNGRLKPAFKKAYDEAEIVRG